MLSAYLTTSATMSPPIPTCGGGANTYKPKRKWMIMRSACALARGVIRRHAKREREKKERGSERGSERER
jgi:hypothetical protein